MPWCDNCDRFLSPNTVRDDGTCPECGSTIINPHRLERVRKGRGSSADAAAVRAERRSETGGAKTEDGRSAPTVGADQGDERTPWHFKVLLVALIIYLGWRLIQGILWVAHKL